MDERGFPQESAKMSNSPKWLKTSPLILSLVKNKKGYWEQWVGTSKGRKASHMEVEKQMFGQQMFSGP